jgi:TRAP-type C4-dicarboxylate transport system permease small subunit
VTRGAIERGLFRLSDRLALLGFTGLCVAAALTTYEGAARFAGWPRLPGLTDILSLVMAVIIASAFPSGLLAQSNVTIRFLGKALPRSGYRVLELIGGSVTLVFFTLVTWQFLLFVIDQHGRGATTRTIEVPVAPAWLLATLVMSVAIPAQCLVLHRWLNALRGRADDPEH